MSVSPEELRRYAPYDVAIRQTAIQELGRSCGAGAFDVPASLLGDASEPIRENTVRVLARFKTADALVLLQRAASSDPSPEVRARAKAGLPSAP